MKILWLSHFAPYPPKGGAPQRSFNMLKQLSKNADVTLLALASYGGTTAHYDSYEDGLREIAYELNKVCSKAILIPHGHLNRKKNRLMNGLKSLVRRAPYDVLCLESKDMQAALSRLLRTEEYDAIHVDTIGLWPYVKGVELPIILNHHNIESAMLYRRADNSNWPLRTYLKIQAKKVAALETQADTAMDIVCSGIDSVALCSRHVVTIPNGVDLEYFYRTTTYEVDLPISLIFAGGLNWYPNHEAMVFFATKIWPLLKKSDITVDMRVIGGGSVPALNELARKDSDFRVLDFVPDVRPYLEESSIYVCPIMDGGGTKLKVLDALAMGVPLVAHPIACEGIEVIEGVHVLFATSAQEFSDQIVFLAKNKELRIAMSVNGRQLIKDKYDYDKIGITMNGMYKECIDSQNAP